MKTIWQTFDGYVTDLSGDQFVARLVDITAGQTFAGYEATIPIHNLSEQDQKKIQVGTLLRWLIGQEGSHFVLLDDPLTAQGLADGRRWTTPP